MMSGNNGTGVLQWLERFSIKHCCFDFGGTLFDFEPVHLAAFRHALNLDPESRQARELEQVLRASLQAGVDSVDISQRLAVAFGLSDDPLQIVLSKRQRVEELVANSELTPTSRDLLVEVADSIDVSIVTRGLKDSTLAIVNRSLPVRLVSRIAVFGRADCAERWHKSDLLETALSQGRFPFNSCGYVADADGDAIVASSLKVLFYRFQPFLT